MRAPLPPGMPGKSQTRVCMLIITGKVRPYKSSPAPLRLALPPAQGCGMMNKGS
jgi:hypothetical protein